MREWKFGAETVLLCALEVEVEVEDESAGRK